jgi:hypothetical protein
VATNARTLDATRSALIRCPRRRPNELRELAPLRLLSGHVHVIGHARTQRERKRAAIGIGNETTHPSSTNSTYNWKKSNNQTQKMRRVQRLATEIDRIPLSTREPTKKETEWANCAPGQMALPAVNRERQTGSYSQSRTTRGLASLAVRAPIEEAELTPKPALVDGCRGGAQEDLSVFLM